MFYLVSIAIFLFAFGGNLPLALVCWLLFVCFIKPDDMSF